MVLKATHICQLMTKAPLMTVDLQDDDGDVRGRVDGADDPGIVLAGTYCLAKRARICNVKFLGKREVGPIGTGWVLSLDGGSDRVYNHQEVQRLGMVPATGFFILQDVDILGAQPLDAFNAGRVLCDQGSLLENGEGINKPMLLGVDLDIT
ncbi:hypothetical protein MMC13_000872 [Lambiella insularis]|nr:hypothetical protein [Lambiella insularis]